MKKKNSKLLPYSPKDPTEPAGLMKIDRTQIPYEPKESRDDLLISGAETMADEDADKMFELAREGKTEEMNDLINSRMAPYEQHPGIYKGQSGMLTRDYVNRIFGKGLNDKIPGLAETKDDVEAAKKIRTQLYPGLNEALKSYNYSDKITNDPEKGSKFDSYRPGPENEGMNIETDMHPSTRSATIAHELGHGINNIGRNKRRYGADDKQEASIENMKRLKPATASVLDDEEKKLQGLTTSEDGYVNYPFPNFSDYDFESGNFKSDVQRTPASMQDQISRDHHGRNYPLENIINMSKKGGLDNVVENQEDPKFQELLKKLRARA
jgi:hypothetical protein